MKPIAVAMFQLTKVIPIHVGPMDITATADEPMMPSDTDAIPRINTQNMNAPWRFL